MIKKHCTAITERNKSSNLGTMLIMLVVLGILGFIATVF